MSLVEVHLPKMGESITEATILNWLFKEGESITDEDTLVEIATDKVDSEIPSPVSGVIKSIKYQVDDVVPIGSVIAVIETAGNDDNGKAVDTFAMEEAPAEDVSPARTEEVKPAEEIPAKPEVKETPPVAHNVVETTNTFLSPLVRKIASDEGVSKEELAQIIGTGREGRVTKKDILSYIANRGHVAPRPTVAATQSEEKQAPVQTVKESVAPASSITPSGNMEIVEMDRMRKLIAKHMVQSVQEAPHVTSFVEVDVTNMVLWRKKNKKAFEDKYGQRITFTPLFVEAVVKALRDFPGVNASVNGDQIILKKDLNIGIAAALPSGNLIVPVIKGADRMNLVGLAEKVNDLVYRARENKLKPNDIQDATFTISNVGTFGNIMGTPIINQPQVAILATGIIQKKPVVIETEQGDVIGIRHMMYLSLSYDHRIVDGYLGGSFLKRIGDYMEAFDINTEI